MSFLESVEFLRMWTRLDFTLAPDTSCSWVGVTSRGKRIQTRLIRQLGVEESSRSRLYWAAHSSHLSASLLLSGFSFLIFGPLVSVRVGAFLSCTVPRFGPADLRLSCAPSGDACLG